MKINGVTIQMLPAASGDCIYLEFPDSDFRMLIDGGYAKNLSKVLEKNFCSNWLPKEND